jgi:cyclophilin family peptidyl-prolyl cis-trans isomerase/HEAT repeat protein
MRLPLVAVAALALAGCPRPIPKPPLTSVELTREDRLAIATLEAQRDAAVGKLRELADDRHAGKRALALRALGRIGSAEAIAALRARLVGQEGVVAAAALGVAAATGALEPDEAKAIVGELAALTPSGPRRAIVLEAIGRLGTAAAMAPLSRALGAAEPEVVAAAAIGLGRLGRAKIALDDTTELALIGLTRHAEVRVRYAATFALARAMTDPSVVPAATDPVIRALRDRLKDSTPPIRATAIAGLAARRAIAVTTPDLLDALDDHDWRIAVELVRALGGPAATDATRAALVPFIARVIQEWGSARLPPAYAHVLLEGLRHLSERVGEPKVREVLIATARGLADQPPSARPPERQLAAAWANCLTLAALARPTATVPSGDPLADPAVAWAQLGSCGAGILPEHLATAVGLDALVAGASGPPVPRLVLLAGHGDPRIAAAALERAPALVAAASASEQANLAAALIAALGRGEAAVAGSAIAAAGAIFEAHGKTGPWAPLAAAVVARLDGPVDDAELVAAILEVVGTAKLDALPACQRLATATAPALRAAARTCITELTGTDPGRRAAAAPPARPPIDPDLALRGARTWRLTTSQGEVAIALSPEVAPWHVATIMTLTARGYYDGLLFHRVVPNFVVQGGDPSGTGWGGPGFVVPSEPASLADGELHFDTGAIGVADAGKDTGGSQWFAMHGPTPHLAGRYTWIGQVVEGGDVLDRLLVGDRVIRARLE